MDRGVRMQVLLHALKAQSFANPKTLLAKGARKTPNLESSSDKGLTGQGRSGHGSAVFALGSPASAGAESDGR